MLVGYLKLNMKTFFDCYLIVNHNLSALKLILQTAPTADRPYK